MLRLAAVTILLLAAMLPARADAEKVLRYVPSTDLVILDPQVSTATTTNQHGLMVYDTLYALDSKLVPRPEMVEHAELSPDGLTWQFTLRPGLRFHDGRPVTGADVVASINRWMARDTLGQKMKERMVAFQPEGEHGFSMKFSRRFAFVKTALATAMGTLPVIMRRQDAETDPFKPITTAVGSGPFRFVPEKWVAGASAVWERNLDYVPRAEPPDGLAGGKVVKVDRVEAVLITDPITRVNALEKGEVDLIDQLPQDLIEFAQRDKNNVVSGLSPVEFLSYIRPNSLLPPFNNVKAREALAYLVKQSDYMSGYGPPGWWHECFSYFVCGTPNGTEAGSEPYRTQDLARAKELLAEAGYKGERIVVIAAADNPVQKGLADVTVGALRSIGVNVDMQIMDFGTVLARRVSKKPVDQGGWNLYHSALAGLILTSPVTNPVIDSDCSGNNYYGWPCDKQVERLRDAYLDAPDEATRRARLEDLSRALWKSFPAVFTGQYIQPYVWRKNITGLLKTFPLVFWNVDKTP